jgi:hypothetical protein
MALFNLVSIDGRQHTVTQTGLNTWDVSSATAPGESYEVRRYGQVRTYFACRCRERFPGHRPPKNRVTPCRHARAVAALLGIEVSGAA